jgi:hypothetical protein
MRFVRKPMRGKTAGGARAKLLSARRGDRRATAVTTLGLGVLLALAVAGSIAGYRTWTGQQRAAEKAAWQRSEALRAALRYGELRIPADGSACAAYVFDNSTGVVGAEHPISCDEIDPAPAQHMPKPGEAAGTASRVEALSKAFKR